MINHDSCRQSLMALLNDEVRTVCPDLEKYTHIDMFKSPNGKKHGIFTISRVKFRWQGRAGCRYKARLKGWQKYLALARQAKFGRGSIQAVYESPLARERFEGYAKIIAYLGADKYLVVFKDDDASVPVTRRIIHRIVDCRPPHVVLAELKAAARKAPRCNKLLPDCLYWAWASCTHRKVPDPCDYVSRESRGIGPALGNN